MFRIRELRLVTANAGSGGKQGDTFDRRRGELEQRQSPGRDARRQFIDSGVDAAGMIEGACEAVRDHARAGSDHHGHVRIFGTHRERRGQRAGDDEIRPRRERTSFAVPVLSTMMFSPSVYPCARNSSRNAFVRSGGVEVTRNPMRGMRAAGLPSAPAVSMGRLPAVAASWHTKARRVFVRPANSLSMAEAWRSTVENTMNALWRASEMFVTRGARRILVPNPMTKPSTLSFDGWTLHRDSGELEREGNRVRLQDLPFQILDELLGRPGEVVTREQLIARLWPKTIVDFDTNLNSGVRRLRAALKDDAEAPRYVETLPRRGYRYVGPLPRRERNGGLCGSAGRFARASVAARNASRASRTPPLIWLGVVIALLIAAFAVFRSKPEEARRIVRAEPRRGHLDASAPGGAAVRKPEPRSCQRLLHRWNA